MKNTYRNNAIKSLLLAIGGFVFIPSMFVFMVDPCQIFHRPLPGFLNHGFFGMAVCQNAGLINTYLQDPDEGYDSILIGTSLSGNFLSENIAQKTAWRKT